MVHIRNTCSSVLPCYCPNHIWPLSTHPRVDEKKKNVQFSISKKEIRFVDNFHPFIHKMCLILLLMIGRQRFRVRRHATVCAHPTHPHTADIRLAFVIEFTEHKFNGKKADKKSLLKINWKIMFSVNTYTTHRHTRIRLPTKPQTNENGK